MDEIIEIDSDTDDVECTSIRIIDNKNDDNNSECLRPESFLEEGNGPVEQPFPTWLDSFSRKCFQLVGTKCLKQLDLILDEYLVHLRREYDYCSRSPKRAWYIAQQTYKFLIFFYLYYEDAKDFFITSHWTEHIIEILVIYCKLEIKSSLRVTRGKENDDMIATRIMNLLFMVLESNETHIIHILLKIVRDKCFGHRQRDIFSPIFRKVLSTKRTRELTDLEYIMLVLAFKSWKRLLHKNEKKEISKLCQLVVKQPSVFDKNYKKYRFLPPVPIELSSHEFLITTMFDLPQIVQNYFLFIESKKNKPIDSNEQITKQISLSADLYTNFASEEDLTEDFLESCLPLINSIKEETDKVCPSKPKEFEPKVEPIVIEFIDLTDEEVNEPTWAQKLIELAQNYTQELILKHMTEISLKDSDSEPKLVEIETPKSPKVDIEVDSSEKHDEKLPISSIDVSSDQDVSSSDSKGQVSPSTNLRPGPELEENHSNDTPDSSENILLDKNVILTSITTGDNLVTHGDTTENHQNIPPEHLETSQATSEASKLDSSAITSEITSGDTEKLQECTSKVAEMGIKPTKTTLNHEEVEISPSNLPESDIQNIIEVVIPPTTVETKFSETEITNSPSTSLNVEEKVITECHSDNVVIEKSDKIDDISSKSGEEQEFVDNLFSSELTPKKFPHKEIKITNFCDDNRVNTRSRRSKHVQFTIKEPRSHKNENTSQESEQNIEISNITSGDCSQSNRKDEDFIIPTELIEENSQSCEQSLVSPISNNSTIDDIPEKPEEIEKEVTLVPHGDKRSKKSVAETLFDQLKNLDEPPKSPKYHSKSGDNIEILKDKDVRQCKVEIPRLKIDPESLIKKTDGETLVIPKKSVIKTGLSNQKEKKRVRFNDSGDNTSKTRKSECIAKVYKHLGESDYHQKSDEVKKHRKERVKSVKNSRKRRRKDIEETSSKSLVIDRDKSHHEREITEEATKNENINTYDQAYIELNKLVNNHQNLKVEIGEKVTKNKPDQSAVSYSDFEHFVEQNFASPSDKKVIISDTSSHTNLKPDFSDLKTKETDEEISEYHISNVMSYRERRKGDYVSYKSPKMAKIGDGLEEKARNVKTYSNNRPKIGSHEKYLITNFGFDINDLRKLDVRISLEATPFQKIVDQALTTPKVPKVPKRLSNIDFNVDLKREMINSSKIQSSPTIIERQDYMKSKNNEVFRARIEKRPGFENHQNLLTQKGVKRIRKNEETKMKNEGRRSKKIEKKSTKIRRKDEKSPSGLESSIEKWQYQKDQVEQPWRFG